MSFKVTAFSALPGNSTSLMPFRLSLSLRLMVLVCCCVSLSAAEPTKRAISNTEVTALKEPIAVGKRIYFAVRRYYDKQPSRVYPTGLALFTDSPTIELLHAVGYISDSDFGLARQYRVAIPPVIVKPTDAVVLMQTRLGELSLDASGHISLIDRH